MGTYAPALIEKAVQIELEGDKAMLKLCLDKLVPNLKSLEYGFGAGGDRPVKFVLKMGKDLSTQTE